MANELDFRVKNGLLVTTTATIESTTNSTSTSTGALRILGGVGVANNLNVGGDTRIYSITTATSTATGALRVEGGVGIAGSLFVGGGLNVAGTINATVTGTITTASNIALGTTGQVPFQSAPGSTSFFGPGTSGQLLVSQGASASGPVFTNTGSIYVQNSVISTNIRAGAAGSLPYQSGANATTFLSIGGTGTILTSSGTAPQWSTTSTLHVGVSNQSGEADRVRITNDLSQSTPNYLVAASTSSGFQSLEVTAAWGPFVIPSTGQLVINTSTLATSNSTGALRVGGGVGIAQNLFVGAGATIAGITTVTNTTAATSTGTGALQIRGGAGLAGNLWATGGYFQGGSIDLRDATTSSIVLASLQQQGSTVVFEFGRTDVANNPAIDFKSSGANIDYDTRIQSIGGSTSTIGQGRLDLIANQVYVSSTQTATSTQSGALRVTGGVGIGGNLYVGGEIVAQKLTIELTTVTTTNVVTDDVLTVNNTSNATSTSTGAIVVAGGVGIAKDVWVGGSINVAGTINASVTGIITTASNLANGTAGQVPYQTSPGATSFFGPGTAGQILVSAGTSAPAYTNTSSIYVQNSVISTNLRSGSAGSLPYQSGSDSTTFLGIGATGTILTSSGTAPQWSTTSTLHVGVSNQSGEAERVRITNDISQTTPNYLVAASTSSGFQSLEVTAAWGPFVIPSTGQLIVNTNTNATSTLTGALRVVGGAAFGGAVHIFNSLTIGAGLSASTGIQLNNNDIIGVNQLVFSDPGPGEGINFNSNYQIYESPDDLTTNTGGNLQFVANGLRRVTFNRDGQVDITTTTNATSTSTGALLVKGGAGIARDLWVGGTIYGAVNGSITTATNLAGGTAGQIPFQTSTGVTLFFGPGISGQLLRSNGAAAPSYVNTASIQVGYATNIAGGAQGDILYQDASGTTRFINKGNIGNILQSNGTTATFVSTTTIHVGNANYAVSAGSAGSANNAVNLLNGAAGAIPIQSAANTTQFIVPGSSGQLLQYGTNTATWVNTSTIHVATANFAVNAANVLATVSTASQVNTVLRASASEHFVTFVDSNNATATGESVYTTSSFKITPSNGNVGVGGNLTIYNESQDVDNRYYGGTYLRGWSGFAQGSEANITYTTDSTGTVGTEVLTISESVWARGPRIRLDKTQNYEVEMWIRKIAGSASTATYYMVVSNWDANGNVMGGDGTDWHYPVSGTFQSTLTTGTWVKHSFIVGPYGGSKNHNTTATYIGVGFIANYNSGGTNDTLQLTGFKCRPIPRYSNDALTIFNNGSISIGSTSSTTRLDVAGGARITGITTITSVTASTSPTTGALQVSGGAGIAGNINSGGQIASTRANSATTGDGQIYLNGATGNRIDFNTNGVAAPAFTTRSAGTKIVLYPAIAAASADYAFGIEGSTLWSSIPNNTDTQFKWYGGTTNIATLGPGGNLTMAGDLNVVGGDIVTVATTFNLVNTTATTINFAGATTALTIGATTGYTNIRNATTLTNTTAASSTNTGALQVRGGVGIAGNLYVGGTINGTFSGSVSGTASTASTVNTVLRANAGTHYLTFVDSNNTTATPEAIYTTSTLVVNPGTSRVGIATASPATTLDVRGVIQGQLYTVPNTAGTAQWVRLGTLTIPQQGYTARVRAYLHAGYNADNNQDFTVDIFFKTSNGSSVDGNGWAANSWYYSTGYNTNNVTPRWVGNAAGTTATSYDLFLNLPQFTNASYYAVDIVEGATWTHLGTLGVADPGGASATTGTSALGFIIPIGNVGIGNNAPTSTLDVAGTVKISGLTTVTNLTNASSTNTGALQVAGGVGIGQDLRVGGTIYGNLSGTATNLAGGANGSLPYQTGSGSTTFLSIGTNGFVLTSNGTVPTWQALSGLSSGSATTATNLAAGTAGQVPYQTAPGSTSFFGPGTAGQLLQSNGAAAPSYVNTSSIHVANANYAVSAGSAGSVTNSLTMNNGGSGAASGSTYNGSAARTISYNTIGAPAAAWLTDTGATRQPNSVISADTRSTNYTPGDRVAGLYVDFKTNTTDSLVDGGTYHGVLTFRSYGTSNTDFSGGQAQQIAYTDNNNLWHRISTNSSTWGTWYKIIDTNNTSTAHVATANYAATAGSSSGASGVTTVAQTAAANYFVTFVDSNNATATAESVFTTSTLVVNPGTGSVGVGGNPATTIKLDVFSPAGNSTSPTVRVSNSTAYIQFLPSNAAGGYNPLASSGDQSIIFTGGTQGSGNLIISPWSSTSTGIRITAAGVVNIPQSALINTVRIGASASNEIDTSAGNLVLDSTGGTVTVDDNLSVSGNATITGNLTVNGTTITVDSTVTNVSDPIFVIGTGPSGADPLSDDNKDRGIAFKWHNGTSARTGFFGFDDSTGYFTFLTSATITGEIVAAAGGTSKGAVDVNIAGGSAMSLVYQSAADTTAFLAAGTSGHVLQTNGTGSAPSWVPVSSISAGTSTNANAILTTVRDNAATHFITFVDSNNNTPGAYEALYTTATITLEPSNGNLTISGDLTVAGGQITTNAVSTRDKFRVWNDTTYVIGMQNSFTFGSLESDYAMTFQMSNTDNRGFWWGDSAHTQAQGAMALSTNGKLTVAHSVRVGYGESDTTLPGATYVLDVNGAALVPKLYIGRSASAATGINWYSNTYTTWQTYMAQAGQTSVGTQANITVPSGTYVTSWGLRNYIEDAAGYGWTWESGTGTSDTTPTVVAEIRSSDGTMKIAGDFLARSKSFLIDHPTKPGMKLRYGSLEGPENGVYIRGKLVGKNIIELPEYWVKLVDPDSITVNLTPIGRHQNLYVEDIADNKVIIGNSNLLNKDINCFYTVFAERKDIDKLEVESF